jgi:hypothetical protein
MICDSLHRDCSNPAPSLPPIRSSAKNYGNILSVFRRISSHYRETVARESPFLRQANQWVSFSNSELTQILPNIDDAKFGSADRPGRWWSCRWCSGSCRVGFLPASLGGWSLHVCWGLGAISKMSLGSSVHLLIMMQRLWHGSKITGS